jgi:type 1 fimbriae regulatory protein FimB/type 1 fimbriae regulatory protein FimE
MIQRTGVAAKLPNDGQDTRSLAHYLGHRNLQSTARYTALAPDRFAKFWKD